MVKRFCPECECERLVETRPVKETFTVRTEEVTVCGNLNFCAVCGSPLGDSLYDDLLNKAYDVYRDRHGMMSAEEIRSIREGYGLTQALFAKILKIGEATLQRYERGSLPSLSLHALLAKARDRNQFLVLAEESRQHLTREEYELVRNAASGSGDEDMSGWMEYLSRPDTGSGSQLFQVMMREAGGAEIQEEISELFARQMLKRPHEGSACRSGNDFSDEFAFSRATCDAEAMGAEHDLAA